MPIVRDQQGDPAERGEEPHLVPAAFERPVHDAAQRADIRDRNLRIDGVNDAAQPGGNRVHRPFRTHDQHGLSFIVVPVGSVDHQWRLGFEGRRITVRDDADHFKMIARISASELTSNRVFAWP